MPAFRLPKKSEFQPVFKYLISLALVAAAVLQMPSAQAEGGKRQLAEVITVTLGEAKQLYDLGAVFIDVRDDDEWALGHIRGARHVNFRKNFARLKTLEGIDSDTALVFYCAMRQCKAGPYAAAVSQKWGFQNVFFFPRGYFAWMLKDYPIEINPAAPAFAGDILDLREAKPIR